MKKSIRRYGHERTKMNEKLFYLCPGNLNVIWFSANYGY